MHTRKRRASSSRPTRKRRASSSRQSEDVSAPMNQNSLTQIEGTSSSIDTVFSSTRTRSITRGLNNFGRRHGEKLQLEWNDEGQPTGDNATRFANLLGTTLRLSNLVSLQTKSWPEVPKDVKDSLWKEIMKEADIDESRKKWVMQSVGRKYSSWKNSLKKKFKEKKTYEERLENRPLGISKADWIGLVNYWSKPEIKAIADKNTENRRKQLIPHTGGTKSFARYARELTVDGCPPNRIEMFCHMHTADGGKGNPINEKAEAILSKFNEWSANQDSTSVSADEYFMEVMGPERHGRVRGYGLGPTPTSVFGPSSSQTSHGTYSQVCSRLNSVLNEMEHMKAIMSQQIQEEKEKQEKTEKQLEQMQEQMQQFMQKFQQFMPSKKLASFRRRDLSNN